MKNFSSLNMRYCNTITPSQFKEISNNALGQPKEAKINDYPTKGLASQWSSELNNATYMCGKTGIKTKTKVNVEKPKGKTTKSTTDTFFSIKNSSVALSHN